MEKIRIDVALCEQGFAASRQRAKEIITGGFCKVNGVVITKPGAMIMPDDAIEVEGGNLPYVSRGGLKLKKAIDLFQISLSDRVCLDVGASTGGFTDCMLQEGAAGVYAVDTGRDQLVECLCRDSRVCNLEQTNAKDLSPEILKEKRAWDRPSFAAMDISFVSVTKVLPSVFPLIMDHGELVVLVKPQFEAGPALVGKKGIVKDKKIHKKVLQDVYLFLQQSFEGRKIGICGISWSPIKGGEGNIEFLLHLKLQEEGMNSSQILRCLDQVVEDAHEKLK